MRVKEMKIVSKKKLSLNDNNLQLIKNYFNILKQTIVYTRL